MEKGLVNFFEEFISKKPVFKNKAILQSQWSPETIPHRDEQMKLLANIIAPVLRGERPSNVFISGKTGTGKTLVAKYTASQLEKVAAEKKMPIKIVYINCKLKKLADTEFRLVSQLLHEYDSKISVNGLATDAVYSAFYNTIDKQKHNLILILDEIDELMGKVGDELLYNLTRINTELKNAQVTLIGISNNHLFADSLDPRVRSSLSEEGLIFPPYNAEQIQDILHQRSLLAFNPSTLEEGLLSKCAALAARNDGDARRALDLLRVAGEIAERDNEQRISLSHLDRAEEKLERDHILEIVTTQPKQFQVTLYSIIEACKGKKGVFTGEIYSLYERYCADTGLRPLTQRRISDVIAELDMLGIVNAKVVSKGRYGRTREIGLSVQDAVLEKIKTILVEELGLQWNS